MRRRVRDVRLDSRRGGTPEQIVEEVLIGGDDQRPDCRGRGPRT
jgi:hypothetical protein